MEIQVTFPSGGEQVVGMLHLPDRTPVPGLAMCHGFTGHKAETHRLFVKAARDFARHGLAVLRFDFRGSGDSAGEFREMTVSREIEDAGAAMGYLISRPEVIADRVGILGLSLGGCVAACQAGMDPRVKALVLWAATAHPDRIADRMAPDFAGAKARPPGAGELSRARSAGVNRSGSEAAGSDVLDMNGWGLGRGFIEDVMLVRPLEQVARYTGPSLVVHGSNDETVPASDASDYRITLGGGCRVHIVEGADHVFSTLAYESEAIGVSRDFLIQVL